MAAPQDWIRVSNRYDSLHERQKIALTIIEVRPVDPGDLIVLRVGVVVSALRPRDLVSMRDHRRALREHQRRDHALHRAIAAVENPLFFGWSFGAPVAAVVVIRAVLIILAVGLVMLVLVAHE